MVPCLRCTVPGGIGGAGAGRPRVFPGSCLPVEAAWQQGRWWWWMDGVPGVAMAAQPGCPQDISDEEQDAWCCMECPHVGLVRGQVLFYQLVCCPRVHRVLPASLWPDVWSRLWCEWLELVGGHHQQKNKKQFSPSHPKTEFMSL